MQSPLHSEVGTTPPFDLEQQLKPALCQMTKGDDAHIPLRVHPSPSRQIAVIARCPSLLFIYFISCQVIFGVSVVHLGFKQTRKDVQIVWHVGAFEM